MSGPSKPPVYRPLDGIRVLDLGRLIPPALTTAKLAALGAEVVKVEEPGRGDYLRRIPPLFAGEGAHHMTMNRGKRSIALDLRDEADRAVFFRLARATDVIVENATAGSWARLGIDFASLRRARPALVVCSVNGFGQTGPLATMPSHGQNIDALAAVMPVVWRDGQPHIGPVFTSWGNEIGATYAALAVTAAVLRAKTGGEGAWIDLSCWDALAETHRVELAMMRATEKGWSYLDAERGALYDTYLAADGGVVLFCAIEKKFWESFCRGVGREDLVPRWEGEDVDMGDGKTALRAELESIFATATRDEWNRRFLEWGIPGSSVLDVEGLGAEPHLAARGLLEDVTGVIPNVATAIRWHHTNERAGAGMPPPPAIGADREAILRDWLGETGGNRT